MKTMSRRERRREFSRRQAQAKPATAAIRRRLRDQQQRERRLIKAMEAYARVGTVIADGKLH
jgi:hypothetical protein